MAPNKVRRHGSTEGVTAKRPAVNFGMGGNHLLGSVGGKDSQVERHGGQNHQGSVAGKFSGQGGVSAGVYMPTRVKNEAGIR